MELKTISNVSKGFKISTRTLRYYEQIGLIKSSQKEGYAYRVYDEETVAKTQQILILRKLSISLKNIARIMENRSSADALSVFQERLKEIEDERESLSTLKAIIEMLRDTLKRDMSVSINEKILSDDKLIELLNSVAPIKNDLKERKNMEDLNKASDKLGEIKNVRIIFIPPATMASAHYIGDEPEDAAGSLLEAFIKDSGLCEAKPDFRVYGFNNPNLDENGNHGYEFWVTVPDDIAVKAPMVKKCFEGGLYAAHCIKMGDFHEWHAFGQWMQESTEYEYDRREPLGMDGTLEEHLNAYNYYNSEDDGREFIQLDLLIPIKKR